MKRITPVLAVLLLLAAAGCDSINDSYSADGVYEATPETRTSDVADGADVLAVPLEDLEQALRAGPRLARVDLHDCTTVGFPYRSAVEAAAASLPDGYAPVDPEGDGEVVVLVDIFGCESFSVGTSTFPGGTMMHERLLDGVVAPDGSYVGWGYPATHTSPHMRRAFERIGIPSRPARDMYAAYDGSYAEASVDNVPAFGPDVEVSFETTQELVTFPAGAAFVQHHAFPARPVKSRAAGGRGRPADVLAMQWVFTEDVTYYAGAVTSIDVEGAFSLPVVATLPFPGVAITNYDTAVESVAYDWP